MVIIKGQHARQYRTSPITMFEETHMHIKSEKRYGAFGYGKVQISNIWHDAVFYADASGAMYCRTKSDFDAKFIPIES